ncbi:MAG: YbjN domain-containing protein, partial [Pseudonocardiaceae bacterium]
HGVLVEAFVCRRPDEAHGDVYRWLLRRNARLYGVHYALDKAGDIYLVGRLAHHAVTADELDRVLGQVAEAADGDFNTLLEIGFASSIRREWDWRVARGQSLGNLAVFEHLIRFQ